MATVELIIGPMFSGKTTELLRRARARAIIGARVLYVVHVNDAQRTQDMQQACFRTHAHDMQTGPNVMCASSLTDLDDAVRAADVVAVDEVQFFPDLEAFVLRHEHRADLTVLLAGLDADAERRAFGQTLTVIPLCDKVTKLRAYDTVTQDGRRASFSLHMSHTRRASCIEVGGSERYAAVSRETYLRLYNQQTVTESDAAPVATCTRA